MHCPKQGRAAASAAPSMGYCQRCWPLRGLCSRSPGLSQAGVSSWLCFKRIRSSLDVVGGAFVAFGRKHGQPRKCRRTEHPTGPAPAVAAGGQTLLGFGASLSPVCTGTSADRKEDERDTGQEGASSERKEIKATGLGAAGKPGATFGRCCSEHRPAPGPITCRGHQREGRLLPGTWASVEEEAKPWG